MFPPSSNLEAYNLFSCVLLRGEDGELRLGIRRAVRPRNGLPESVIGKQNSYPSILSMVATAISTKSMFRVSYSPRYCYLHKSNVISLLVLSFMVLNCCCGHVVVLRAIVGIT